MTLARYARLATLAGAVMVSATVALAQDTPQEQEERRVLHAEQAKLAAQQMSDFEAQKKAIADEQAAREQTYRDALAARDAEIAAEQAQAAEARAKWEADVAACLAGDKTKCAPLPPKTRK
ncbi:MULTISPECIES: hypothetical protein [Sphingobium]|uniref:hypothetical protein n=1 Tax=Sphingobium TaxID=165695 RepID=UPI0015EB8C02|nr:MULTISPECIES: hypothetical protein [Sphingobium]MCW2362666.1 fused signal recognition particle receptor [Sphingobium sp. B10D3B]MCW2388865.1 fused signal recognition particle receptor [Sphingobium sp. B11D3B]MCW2400654.1 fused signal recognition particle receptor [Sphingobium sp. B10D7B]MCW2407633.1 fused signal recognition particle receptor [Sphingobium xanthum]